MNHINTDLYYLLKGYITLTPILVDRTNYEIMSKISIFFDNGSSGLLLLVIVPIKC
jgi:hypothetical protein